MFEEDATFAQNCFNRLCQTEAVELVGPQIVGDLSDFADCLRSRFGNLSHPGNCRALIVGIVETEKRAVLD